MGIMHSCISLVRLSPGIEQQNQVYNCKANTVGVVYNELMKLFMCLPWLFVRSHMNIVIVDYSYYIASHRISPTNAVRLLKHRLAPLLAFTAYFYSMSHAVNITS